jgi:glycosyltransferase involved in cell wall biosynthesis
LISVVVPAHNEGPVIERCLAALLGGEPRPGEPELEVIVVCNGCRDDTAQRAARFAPRARVLETPRASKVHALNLGDAAARGFPRFYVDADVVLPRASLLRVCEVLAQGEVLAAAPRQQIPLEGASWAVRAFYRTWLSLPFLESAALGGAYGVSQTGRARFGQFPDLIADDGYVRLQFAPAERRVLPDVSFQVLPPRRLWSLVRIKARAQLGNLELRSKYPELQRNEELTHGRALLRLTREPRRWPELLVYLAVRSTARALAWRALRFGAAVRWERDETSRAAS